MNNTKIKSWLGAFRLRTLPLASAAIIVGSFLHYRESFNGIILTLTWLTALSLQILSNLANDYGDSQKGTDNENRIGPQRAVQSGEISSGEMKVAITINVAICLVLGISLIVYALGIDMKGLMFLLLGIGAIAAAIKYTVGKTAYGYQGFGDVFVMLFFGFVAVLGSAYLQTKAFQSEDIFVALGLGCFSTGVLNLNNMRDIDNDRASGKNTLLVKIGANAAKVYHILLIATGIAATAYYIFQTAVNWLEYLPVLTFPILIVQLMQIEKINQAKDFDPFLKKLALTTFAFSLLFMIGKLAA